MRQFDIAYDKNAYKVYAPIKCNKNWVLFVICQITQFHRFYFLLDFQEEC